LIWINAVSPAPTSIGIGMKLTFQDPLPVYKATIATGTGATRWVLIRLTVLTKHADNGVASLQEKHPWQTL
jgi:hypothetical protein